ncbi:MAG: flavin reductase family protein [Chloroflexi bacterium]|nr:flavin reductase family protein [Chloroflexota bacterium]
MGKVQTGPQRFNYLMPVVLVGTTINDRPNFMTVASCGEVCAEPPMVSVAIRRHRYTHGGIRQHMTFSVNIPSMEQVKEADFCGITTGAKVDKAARCKFKVFYGKLRDAPLIEQCPVNLGCRVIQIINLGSHTLFIGSIEETHVSESVLVNGKPTINSIQPFIYSMVPSTTYYQLGEEMARAFSIGKELK